MCAAEQPSGRLRPRGRRREGHSVHNGHNAGNERFVTQLASQLVRLPRILSQISRCARASVGCRIASVGGRIATFTHVALFGMWALQLLPF